MKGWECPKCGQCYAPFVTECKNCNKIDDITYTLCRYCFVCGGSHENASCPNMKIT